MLYDNGPLLGLWADAWLQTAIRSTRARRRNRRRIMREMQSPRGLYHRLDADSEHESKFYVWDRSHSSHVEILFPHVFWTQLQNTLALAV